MQSMKSDLALSLLDIGWSRKSLGSVDLVASSSCCWSFDRNEA